jgi:hypothetical protein
VRIHTTVPPVFIEELVLTYAFPPVPTKVFELPVSIRRSSNKLSIVALFISFAYSHCVGGLPTPTFAVYVTPVFVTPVEMTLPAAFKPKPCLRYSLARSRSISARVFPSRAAILVTNSKLTVLELRSIGVAEEIVARSKDRMTVDVNIFAKAQKTETE